MIYLKPYTRADIDDYMRGDEEKDFVPGRWGTFWELGEEGKAVEASEWWCRKLRGVARKFAREHLDITDATSASHTIERMANNPVEDLYEEMKGKWPGKAWNDTDVRAGHLFDDVKSAFMEIYDK